MMNTKSMKHLMLFAALLVGGWLTQSTAQTTEGNDFWLTFLRADADNPHNLSLTFSAKRECDVIVENVYTNLSDTFHVDANSVKMVEELDRNNCYVSYTNIVRNEALHIRTLSPTDTISVFAGNYRNKSFDASNILPVTALRSEYIVQAYPASDHEDNNQGTHFAVVATEDNTVVEYTPTVYIYDTQNGSYSRPDSTYRTDTLQAGQVWYVWSGAQEKDESDLTGSHIKALDGKPIAVFCGNPHTNIPYQIRDRDHLYEQAMPVDFWGTKFVITGTMLKNGTKRKHDYVKITALNDETVIWKDGQPYDTISFAKYPKRTITMELTDAEAFYLESSCPVEVFLYMTSNRDDDSSGKTNGDPAMVWINPIEQQLSDITFISYLVHGQSSAKPEHFVNIVTDTTTAKFIEFDGTNISASFQPLASKPYYAYAQYWISNSESSEQHHIQATNGGGFIAHAYGFGEKESYAYSAGGATKELKQVVTINGKEFSADTQNQLCGVDTVLFECDLNYDFENITWTFGDGQFATGTNHIKHYYAKDGIYQASVVIERLSSNLCQGQTAKDSIPITVTIGRMRIIIDSIDQMICASNGKFRIYYSNPMEADLENGNVTFNNVAVENGFTNSDNLVFTKQYFEITVPEDAKSAQDYALDIVLKSDCGNDTVSVPFTVNYRVDKNLAQRANDILAVYNENYDELGSKFVSFQWYRNGEPIEGETDSYLNLNGAYDYENEYFVCMKTADGDSLCSCPTKFKELSSFSINENNTIVISSTSVEAGGSIYITTKEAGTYIWYDATGKVLKSGKLPVGGDLITVPGQKGFSLLSIKAEDRRNFKILIK